ncbi:hypothetical protein ABEB36_009332 [Hypothenemus hampei]|uniref:Uncharacterized protein n=1 Tax=Hypothenemus hampei TaxID=57062 RepID=A0ABD1EG12_HYPHA
MFHNLQTIVPLHCQGGTIGRGKNRRKNLQKNGRVSFFLFPRSHPLWVLLAGSKRNQEQ